MKSIIQIVLLCLLLSQALTFTQEVPDQHTKDIEALIDEAYARWREEFVPVSRLNNALFLKSANTANTDEKKQVFAENYKIVEAHNKLDSTYKMKLNKFAELTPDQFKTMYLSTYDSYENAEDNLKNFEPTKIESIDWVSQGLVSQIKNQKTCGSCWAFSANSAIESAYGIKYQKDRNFQMLNLSEQQLVDCSHDKWHNMENSGCHGGWPMAAFTYSMNNSMDSQESYPYENRANERCKFDPKGGVSSLRVKSYSMVESDDSDQMKAAVAQQVISIAIAANDLMFYDGGIYNNDRCSTQVNHAVNIVGFGEENGVKFWKVRNSWSTGWGEQGYLRILRTEGKGRGMCNMLAVGSYPTIADN